MPVFGLRRVQVGTMYSTGKLKTRFVNIEVCQMKLWNLTYGSTAALPVGKLYCTRDN